MRDRLNLGALWVLGFAIAILFSFVNVAHATNVTLNWPAVTTCADNSLAATNCPITNYKVNEGATQTGTFTLKETVAASILSRVYDLTPGTTKCFSLNALAGTVSSDESARVCATVPFLPPKAPQGLTVTVSVTVTTP